MSELVQYSKRYWLFFGDTYYPSGGMYDYAGSFDSIEDAKAYKPVGYYNWAHVFDTETGERHEL